MQIMLDRREAVKLMLLLSWVEALPEVTNEYGTIHDKIKDAVDAYDETHRENWEGFIHTGGDCYWIQGIPDAIDRLIYEVRREDHKGDVETTFTGSYSECRAYIQKLFEQNADYDLDL